MLNVLMNCGGITMDDLIPTLTSTFVTVLKIFIPVALVFFGMLDLGKAVIASDDKAMKENQSKLIKRFIYAVLVFLIVSLVQVIFGFVAKADESSENSTKVRSAVSCVSCFVNGPESDGCKGTKNVQGQVK